MSREGVLDAELDAMAALVTAAVPVGADVETCVDHALDALPRRVAVAWLRWPIEARVWLQFEVEARLRARDDVGDVAALLVAFDEVRPR